MPRIICVLALACLFLDSPAHARNAGTTAMHPMCNVLWPCTVPNGGKVQSDRARLYPSKQDRARIARAERFRRVDFGSPLYPPETQRSFLRGVEILGGRPAGCPRRFCGCGVSLKVFGRIIPDLNLAANWKRFASATPGAGTVAWRPGHVLFVEAHLGGTMYQVYDPNSGGGKIRRHVRNLAGYRFVDPSRPA